MGDAQVQKANRMRLAASKAYHEADCDQALQAALHAGPRVRREFEAGQMVYFWRKGTDQNEPKYWRGPARVILSSPPTTVWITFKGQVIKAAPEQLRHASLKEKFTLTGWIDDIAKTRHELEQKPTRGYIDLTLEEHPKDDDDRDYDLIAEDEQAPHHRLRRKTTLKEITEQKTIKRDEKEITQAIDVWGDALIPRSTEKTSRCTERSPIPP